MSVDEENINTEIKAPASKPKKSFFARLAKVVMILFACFILLLIGLFFFIQTDWFDEICLGILLDKVNTSLEYKDSRINAESLEGNLLKGFTLKNGSIIVKGDTMLVFKSIYADYDIWKLFNNDISLDKVILRQPKIFLTKIRDKNDSLKWNILHFLESEKKVEDTTDTEFDWDVSAENFEIEDGAVRVLNEKSKDYYTKAFKMQQLDSFDLGNFDMYNLNLKLGVNYFLDDKNVSIRELTFKTNSPFNLNQFSMDAKINKKDTTTSIQNFTLLTDRTFIKINELFVQDLNPFRPFIYENLKDKNVRIDLMTDKFDMKDLTFFLPGLDFLDSTATLNLIADGPYGNLNISRLYLQIPNSNFSFEGNVKNLDHPSDLYFDITGKDITIDPRDTKISLPGIPIPDYNHMGKVFIPYVTYKGEPTRFSTDFDVRSSAGNVNGNGYMDLTQNVSKYRGDFTTSGLNIGKIVKDNTLESNINGDFKIDAAGFDYKSMSGKINYDINRTRFYGQNISRSAGQLNFNRGNVSLDLSFSSDALQTKVAGKVNISNLNNISYDLRGTATNLNIAAFTKDNSQRSNLDFTFDINGRGFDPNNISGNYKINMSPSTFGDYKIPATPLDVELDQNGNVRKISMKSDFVDLTADGLFNITTLTNVITANIEKIQAGLNKKFYDSLQTSEVLNRTPSPLCNDLNFKYTINVKDLGPLYTFTGGDTINFKGNFDGSLSDSCGIMYFISNGVIKELRMKDSLLITNDALLNINIRNDVNALDLTGFDADAVFSANKLIVSGFALDTTNTSIKFFENQNKFNIRTMQDSAMKFITEGSLRDSLVFHFDTLAFQYKDFVVTNNKDLIVKYKKIDSSEAIEFRQFAINNLNQRLLVAGEYSLNDSSNISISASNIDLLTYQKLINPDQDTNNMLAGKVRYFDLKYQGVPAFPIIDITAVSEQLSLGSTQIGRLDADLKYKEYKLTPNIVFSNKNNTGKFSLTGSVPMLLTFSGEEIDSVQRAKILAGREADLNAVAKNFQLKVLQQLIPYTSGLEGILNGKISLVGTSDKPVLTGNMKVDNGKFYVTLTKMNYDFIANLSTKDEKLLIDNSKVFVPEELSRFISASGYIDFTGFTLNDMKLVMTGDVKAFDKNNGGTELGVEGDLWVGSGRNSLTLKGNSDRFDLTGNLILVKGNIVFNPFKEEAYNIYTDDFVYGVIIDSLEKGRPKTTAKSVSEASYLIDDSTKALIDSSKTLIVIDSSKTGEDLSEEHGDVKRMILMQNPDSIVVLNDIHLNPFEKIVYIYNNKQVKKIAREKSGKFFYNILVTTSENVFLKFIVNEKTQQEFFGEIRTEDLNIYNDVDYTMQGRGTITLGDNCYYKFFRKFDASGNVRFYGPITNPDLNISAQYKGYSTSGANTTGQENLEDVVIDMKVSGEAKNPLLTITLTRGASKETGSNATSDAISFLLFGKFQDQLSFGESTSFGANIGASFLSNYLSSSLETIFPFLINTSFNYVDSKSGTIAQNTDVRFTASIGDAVIRFGGQIFKGIANTDIVLDYPLNKILKISSLSNNLIFRFERVYDPFYSDNDISNTNGTRVGGLVYYKIKF
ncbi:MAG: hypothetical protein ABI462_02560 [Ignavibacteria bacterium]